MCLAYDIKCSHLCLCQLQPLEFCSSVLVLLAIAYATLDVQFVLVTLPLAFTVYKP